MSDQIPIDPALEGLSVEHPPIDPALEGPSVEDPGSIVATRKHHPSIRS